MQPLLYFFDYVCLAPLAKGSHAIITLMILSPGHENPSIVFLATDKTRLDDHSKMG